VNGQWLDPKVTCSAKILQRKAGFWMYRGAAAMS
jgi:hypothetical protein